MSSSKRKAPQPKVVFEGVSKTFKKKGEPLEVLSAIDLTVDEGEFVCLLGPSGCGKSTLLNIAGGFERPTRGSVKIDGAEIVAPSSKRVFVFQEYGIFPWASVWDNVVLGIRHKSKAEQHRIVGEVIELVGLEGFGIETVDSVPLEFPNRDAGEGAPRD